MRAALWVACLSAALVGRETVAQTVVVPNDNVGFSRINQMGDYRITVCPQPVCTDPGFPYFATISYSGDSIAVSRQSADLQYYHVADFGDVFNPRVIGNSLGEVGTGDFYLGIWIPVGDPLQPPPLQDYGWVHLRPVNGELTMVSNAMSYLGRGIVIGTTIVVPEPGTVAIAMIGLLGLLKFRKRESAKSREGWQLRGH
jgi:hypothetical protein